MTAILTSLFPIGLRLFGLLLDRLQASQEARLAFQALVSACQKDGLVPAQASKSFQDIDKELNK